MVSGPRKTRAKRPKAPASRAKTAGMLARKKAPASRAKTAGMLARKKAPASRAKTAGMVARKKAPAASNTRLSSKKTASRRRRGGAKTLGRAAAARTKPVKKIRTVCLSHKEDLDGLSAAALIKIAHGGDTILSDYPSQMKHLADIASDQTLKRLFVCDLGLSKKNQDEFVDIIQSLRKRRVSVTYIDHHALDSAVARRLSGMGVRMIHDTGECASVLVYATYKKKMNDHSTFVASCAAITDYMEDRPIASGLVEMYDRQFALISATVMTYNITGHQKDNEYLLSLVDDLASSRFPHEIPDTFAFARDQVERLSGMIARVKEGMTKTRNLAHMEITDIGAGGVVNFVLGMSGKNVGVAYKAKKNEDFYSVSVRGSRACKLHLGKIVNTLASELGGSGGGHDRACGAVIPIPKIKRFVSELNRRIGS